MSSSFKPALRQAMCELMEKRDSVSSSSKWFKWRIVMSKMSKVECSPQKYDSSTLAAVQAPAAVEGDINWLKVDVIS